MSRLLKALSPTPRSWSNETHFCKWNGVVCNLTSNYVNSITLPSSSLTGTIPSDLYTLFNLIHIDLHNNSLTGPFPSLSGLNALETVLLGHNNFTSIPDYCFNFILNLKTLNLSNNLNLIPWLFPTVLSASPLLQTIDLQATNMIGSLSSKMFDWFPRLETVILSHNNFTGDLPESLGRSSIKYLKLNNQGVLNKFTGSLEVISSMRLLSQAWLHNNAFFGRIPDLSNCTQLFDLQLHSNILYGMVPPSLMTLPSLKTVSLDDNGFQGPIPIFGKGVRATWENTGCCDGPCDPQVMTLLVIAEAFMDFGIATLIDNGWVRENPCSWKFIRCRRGKIISVNLDGLILSGTISSAFANLTGLVNLTLSGNNLTGSIPHSLTTLPQLQFLDLSNNNLTGQIPNFPSKVKLNTTGNVLLGRKIDDTQSGGPSKTANATSLKPIWIAGASVLSIVAVILVLTICRRKKYLALIQKRVFKKHGTHLHDNVEDFIKSYNLSVPKRYSYA